MDQPRTADSSYLEAQIEWRLGDGCISCQPVPNASHKLQHHSPASDFVEPIAADETVELEAWRESNALNLERIPAN